MLRWCLVSYLALVISAGPMFCCCRAAQIANLASFLLVNTRQEQVTACPHCRTVQLPTSTSEESPSKQDLPANSKKCPCQQEREKCVISKEFTLGDAVRLVQPLPYDAMFVLSLDVITAPLVEKSSTISSPGSGLSTLRSCSSQLMLSMLQLLLQ